MRLQLVLFGTCCLFVATWSQGYNSRVINEVSGPQFRRPATTQQHILSDIQQHQQRYNVQQQPQPQPQFFVQPSAGLEIPLTQQQQQHQRIQGNPQVVRFPQTSQQQQLQPQPQPQPQNVRAPLNNGNSNDPLVGFVPNYIPGSNIQTQQQFQRSVRNQVQQILPSQQLGLNPFPTVGVPSSAAPQPAQDIHTQNFLTLKNLAPQVGPSQSLPSRSFSNKQFQPQGNIPIQQFQPQPQPLPHPQPQIQQQPIPQQFVPTPPFQNILPPAQTEQKLPRQEPNQQFSTAPQFSFNPQPQSQPQAYRPQPSALPPPIPSQQPSHPPPHPPIYQQNPQQQYVQSHQPHIHHHPHQNPHHSAPQYSNYPGVPHFGAPVHSPEQEYKQKIIQKHEQFVQKQYEKSQNKVKQLHEDFVHKQHSIKQEAPVRHPPHHSQAPPRSRPVYPSERDLFSEALKKYHLDHPTTTTTTTTQATTTSARPIQRPTKPEAEKQKTVRNKTKPVKTIGRDELLKQLKAALAEAPEKDLEGKQFEEMDLVLPNGERVQVIRTKDPNLIKGQQPISQDQLNALIAGSAKSIKGGAGLESVAPNNLKDLVLPDGHKVQIVRAPDSVGAAGEQGGLDLSSLASLYGGGAAAGADANSLASSAVISSDSDEPPSIEELARRGLIPEGYEIEGLSSKPKQAPTTAAPPKKKATFVYLEEQADGSFKIQGVKANGEKETKTSGAEVESILERIRTGEIKLPPSVTRLILPNDQEVTLHNGKIVTRSPAYSTTTTTQIPQTTRTTTTTTTTTTTPTPTPYTPQRPRVVVSRGSQTHYSTTVSPHVQRSSEGYVLHENPTTYYSSTGLPQYHDAYATTPLPIYEQTVQPSSTYTSVTERLTGTTEDQQQEQPAIGERLNPSEDLLQILKTNGLFAMAKYLKQSGLDSILNETGPYTIFVPTDKAFKNLLIQLGGPERAEEKFKSNPRLLSGLLLHHVIPGAFEIATLQDEMTGVSLAGTQLRVNQYTMHDQQWNDVVLTTINGAMVLNDRKDIKIPQGIAHAVDRVMFPLPVGDLLQTLQSDRESRFATFLKILFTSGLSDKLQGKGIKTYTVFAPTEKAFKDLEADALEKLLTDKEAAEEFAMKHIVPGTLFSAGMRFYQVKDSLLTGKTVILQKTSAGKIKVNDAQMVTSNIPSTNGVIHAIDGVLS